MKNALLIILGNAILLAAGILIILVACLQFGNWYPLLTICANIMAIIQLMMCGACASGSSELWSEDSATLAGQQVSWMLFGLLIVMGYAVPGLLWRGGAVPENALYFAWSGGTTILVAMIIYLKLIYIRAQ